MQSPQSFQREALADVVPRLVATARGDEPADLVIRNGTLVSVTSGEILPGFSVAVRGSRIAYVGQDAPHTIGDGTVVIDADGRYIAPGFLDGHCHIESTMLTVSEFARAVLPLGTTGGFFDAHEITNVMGLAGLRMMVEEARTTPLMAYMQVASCVPASFPEFETTGAAIGPEEVAEAMTWGADVIALGEVMNFPGVVLGDEKDARRNSGGPARRSGCGRALHLAGRRLAPRRLRCRGGERRPRGGDCRGRGVAAAARDVREDAPGIGLARRGGYDPGPHGIRHRPAAPVPRDGRPQPRIPDR